LKEETIMFAKTFEAPPPRATRVELEPDKFPYGWLATNL
jgi:hypothetical protein